MPGPRDYLDLAEVEGMDVVVLALVLVAEVAYLGLVFVAEEFAGDAAGDVPADVLTVEVGDFVGGGRLGLLGRVEHLDRLGVVFDE